MSSGTNVVELDDEDLDRRILAARLRGTSVYDLAKMVGKSVRVVTRSLSRTLPEVTPELRQRLFAEDLVRIDELLGAFYDQAKGGSLGAANIVIKLLERRACMTGGQSVTRIEIMATEAIEKPGSTEALIRELDRIAAEGKPQPPALQIVSSEPDSPPAAD